MLLVILYEIPNVENKSTLTLVKVPLNFKLFTFLMLGRSYEKKVTTTDEWMLAHGDSEFVEISKEDGVKDGVKSGN
ncbi:uncharacterized protein OCT59_013466 [Rhizophagus irregularis]|uniref:uncharacterized protein n=1 Tax=Rhizophagus irregularis TaxID=588596 RepID=UPI001C18F558|nr:hypothetical protein OCT59_013466 [Rhizophagus irregularis]CAB4481079.1 unnamed protein product [Rhizophagus irregularis]